MVAFVRGCSWALAVLLAAASATAGAAATAAVPSHAVGARRLLTAPAVPPQFAFLSGRNLTCRDSTKEFNYIVRFFNKVVRDPVGIKGALNAGVFSSFTLDSDGNGTPLVTFTGGDKKQCPFAPTGKRYTRDTSVYLHCSKRRKTFCGVSPSGASACSYVVHWFSPSFCLDGIKETALPPSPAPPVPPSPSPSPPAAGVDPAYLFLAGRTVTCPAHFEWDYRVTFFSKAEQLHRGTEDVVASIGTFAGGNGATGLAFSQGDSFNCPAPRSTAVTLHCASSEFSICGEIGGQGCVYTFDYYSPDLCVKGATPPSRKTYSASANRNVVGNDVSDRGVPKCGVSAAECQAMCDDVATCAAYVYGTHLPWYTDCCWLKTGAGTEPLEHTKGLTTYLAAAAVPGH